MGIVRTLRGLGVAALLVTAVGCGTASGDGEAGSTDQAERVDPTADIPTTTTATEVDRTTETTASAMTDVDRTTGTADTTAADAGEIPSDETQPGVGEVRPASCPDAPDEWSETIDAAVPVAPAPGELAVAVFPTDTDGVIAVFDILPDDLIGGDKQISASRPGVVEARYTRPDRASWDGFQAMDLPGSFMGSVLPEPRADMLVASFVLSDDDDNLVEAAGHDGDLYWVMFVTTHSGEGIDGVERTHTIAWGEACSPWAFLAGAPTGAGRDELVAAFAEAAANLPERAPKSSDELAAHAALLTLDDLGADWRSRPHIAQDGRAFHELATSAMRDEPVCAAALESIERDDLALNGLLDALAATSVGRAESPTFMSPTGVEVEHTVLVFENAEQLTGALSASREVGWIECTFAMYDDLAQAQYDAALPGATISIDSARERPLTLGDDAVALRFELTLEAPDAGGTISVVQDVAIVAIGRAAAALVQQSFGAAIDEDEIDARTTRAGDLLFEQFGGSRGG